MKLCGLLVSIVTFAGCVADDAESDVDGGDGGQSVDASSLLDAQLDDAGNARLDADRVDAESALRDAAGNDGSSTDGQVSSIQLPPANARFDYQLGGAYPPHPEVKIVARDRKDAPAAGLYNICYVNGFQTQPGEMNMWSGANTDLLLRNSAGKPVIDPNWPDEMLLDIRTPEKRARLADIVGSWIEQCARDGFDAVEIDNLDTYSRSDSLPTAMRITQAHAVAYMRLLSDVAHQAGLAIGQKNAAELVDRKSELGTDFVVSEECAYWEECETYTAAYGNNVFDIEYLHKVGDDHEDPNGLYDMSRFNRDCTKYPQLSMVYRDVMLVKPGDSAYVFSGC